MKYFIDPHNIKLAIRSVNQLCVNKNKDDRVCWELSGVYVKDIGFRMYENVYTLKINGKTPEVILIYGE